LLDPASLGITRRDDSSSRCANLLELTADLETESLIIDRESRDGDARGNQTGLLVERRIVHQHGQPSAGGFDGCHRRLRRGRGERYEAAVLVTVGGLVLVPGQDAEGGVAQGAR